MISPLVVKRKEPLPSVGDGLGDNSDCDSFIVLADLLEAVECGLEAAGGVWLDASLAAIGLPLLPGIHELVRIERPNNLARARFSFNFSINFYILLIYYVDVRVGTPPTLVSVPPRRSCRGVTFVSVGSP